MFSPGVSLRTDKRSTVKLIPNNSGAQSWQLLLRDVWFEKVENVFRNIRESGGAVTVEEQRADCDGGFGGGDSSHSSTMTVASCDERR